VFIVFVHNKWSYLCCVIGYQTRKCQVPHMASVKVLALISLIVLASLLQIGEGQKRKKLCRFNRVVGTCTDRPITRKRGMFAKFLPGRCAKKGGSCMFLQKRKKQRCVCDKNIDFWNRCLENYKQLRKDLYIMCYCWLSVPKG
jgi:hypothetical protein